MEADTTLGQGAGESRGEKGFRRHALKPQSIHVAEPETRVVPGVPHQENSISSDSTSSYK